MNYMETRKQVKEDAEQLAIEVKQTSKTDTPIIVQNSTKTNSAMDNFISNFTISEEELKNMEAIETNIIDGVLFEGQIASIVGRPGGGKTVLAKSWAIEMARSGYKVFYIYEDADMKGYKAMADTAQEYGFIVAASFTHVGQTAQTILAGMSAMANEKGSSLNKMVFILDTLKKFTEVLSKSDNKKFYSLLRELTHKGASVLLLAHANKYLNENGDLVYEGTGDALADIDAMYYLYDDGNKLAEEKRFGTLVYEKGRALSAVKRVSYRFNLQQYLAEKLEEPVDTRKMAVQYQMIEHRKDEISVIKKLLALAACSQKELVHIMSEETAISREKAVTLLRALDGILWISSMGGDRKHMKMYRLADPAMMPPGQVW